MLLDKNRREVQVRLKMRLVAFMGADTNSQRNRVLILENRKAGARSSVDEVANLAQLLKGTGFEVQRFDRIDELQDAITTSRMAGTLRVIVAAGGDGTLQLAANLAEPSDPITVLPLGTENLAAKNFGIRRDAQSLAEIIKHGRVATFDAGMANGRLFLVMLSCGFDAAVVNDVHTRRTGHISKWAYAWPIMRAIYRYSFPEIRVFGHLDSERQFELTTSWAFLFNLPRYASGLKIVPMADATDGRLDLRTYGGKSLISGIGHLLTVWLRCQAKWNGASLHQVTKVTLMAKNDGQEIPFQIDGDPGGILPVTVEVLPNRITMMLPGS